MTANPEDDCVLCIVCDKRWWEGQFDIHFWLKWILRGDGQKVIIIIIIIPTVRMKTIF